ncbi:hypothetical protein [Pseudochrobactrum sp. HB0163]|uniref:hypothetical protein n=1 Tax=Pseudochrobactrum sp. HB0163 TaxID=3450708 RepID=UPI003F6DB78E
MQQALETVSHPAEAFTHVRMIIGIILGLCISRLLTGAARFIQHPDKHKIYLVHLAWVGFLLLSVVHFWWMEFGLRSVPVWTFEKYLFVIFYAGLYFMLCTLLFPDNIEEYSGYRDYFISRRRWFFGLLAVLYLTDIGDTLLKGWSHYELYGLEYPIQAAAFIFLSLIAAITPSLKFHTCFALGGFLYQLGFTFRHFVVLI